VLIAGAVLVLLVTALGVWRQRPERDSGSRDPATGTVIQSVQSGELTIALVSASGQLHQGRNTFFIEFRRGDTLVDVGRVGASANMPMPGMVMSSGLQIQPAGVPGRYTATAEFGMAGAWRFSIEWDGPAGRGSANFEGMVQ
jgi:hypothetical protein